VKPTQSVFRLTLRSIPRSIRRVETYLSRINAAMHLDEIQVHKVMVSLTEAVNNAIIHGNRSDPNKKVLVRCEVHPGWLLFIIEDQGRGFHVDQVKNPLKEENLLRESGRGIFLMKTLMDKVEFELTQKGTQVRLWLDTNK
jgi:serine/threonine-protein kinase RsbW